MIISIITFSFPATAAQSFIIITIAGVVIIITATVASIIVILFRKVLSTQTTIEDRILNELVSLISFYYSTYWFSTVFNAVSKYND